MIRSSHQALKLWVNSVRSLLVLESLANSYLFPYLLLRTSRCSRKKVDHYMRLQ